MHAKRRLIHKEIIFAVEPADVSGFYRFRFQIGDKTIEGRVETNLKGMARLSPQLCFLPSSSRHDCAPQR